MSDGAKYEALVQEFCDAWAEGDHDKVVAFFTEDGVYHNIPMAAAEGREAVHAMLVGMKSMISSIRFEVHHQVANGGVVMNERTDHLEMGGKTIALPVVGVFEIVDGKIRAWRDYFDMAQFAG